MSTSTIQQAMTFHFPTSDSTALTRRTLMADLTVRGLRVSPSPKALNVQWNSSSDQATYQILWERADRSSVDKGSTVSEFGSVGGIEGSSRSIHGLIGGERYRIEVTAFNADRGALRGAIQRDLRHAKTQSAGALRREAPGRPKPNRQPKLKSS